MRCGSPETTQGLAGHITATLSARRLARLFWLHGADSASDVTVSCELAADADTLLAKVCEWVGYGIKADPLLRRSAGDKSPPVVPPFPECEKR
jgi:hypothetical protein